MQIVGYEPTARGPALLVREGEPGSGAAGEAGVDRRPLEPGDQLELPLGRRHCAGSIDRETGRHVPCDRPGTPYCEAHASTWVCARCTGTCLKDEMDCFEPHAVYIAAFAPDTVKVGVTRLDRLDTRLREQGADRGAHVHTVSNGRIARELEAEIATELVDRVRIDRKIDGLAAAVDEARWESVLAEFDVIDRWTFDYGVDLDRRPVVETIATGRIVGCKGRLLVLERGGTTYAVDLRELVGHRVRTDTTDRHLQSSLGSFGGA
ncbi:DUF2797 domain-containing protein [Halovivax limisalsi]|uniref:DUF2797 domain-containing protein n=1 Tax=Halovivax limisalsi TaxID=1453760 RepID=UPI001FFCB5E7|nr:DUF2797 domain-containing protein [Halovivax limisalsi]